MENKGMVENVAKIVLWILVFIGMAVGVYLMLKALTKV